MCIIAYTESRALTKAEFERCWKSNPDGFGMAFQKDGKVHVIKGIMKQKEAWETYSEYNNEKAVLHFRIKTAGAICKELTHPFIAEVNSRVETLQYKTSKNILFHNGCIWNWETDFIKFSTRKDIPKITGPVSDTRFIAMLLGTIKEEDKAIEFLKKESGKFVLITTENIYLIGDYEQSKGVHFSNGGYKEYKHTITYPYYNHKWKGYSGYDYSKDYDVTPNYKFTIGDKVVIKKPIHPHKVGDIVTITGLSSTLYGSNRYDLKEGGWVYESEILGEYPSQDEIPFDM